MLVIYSKKTYYNAKINELEKKVTDHNHHKYITTPEFNNIKEEDFNARLARANLVTNTGFDTKLVNLNKKLNSNKTKNLLVENEFKKLQSLGLTYFRGKIYFEEDGTQNYLVFQSINRYFKRTIGGDNGEYINFWKSKWLFDENFTPPATTDFILTPKLSYFGTKTRVEFKGSCLKQDKITHNHGEIVNIYIVYEVNKNYNVRSYPTLENCLFDAISLTKNVDISKYEYSWYGIGFDRKREFSFGHRVGKSVIIFWSKYEFNCTFW